MQEKRNGEPVVRHVNIEMVCSACKKAGEVNECVHEMGKRPRWQKKNRIEEARVLMGDGVDFANEIQGVVLTPEVYFYAWISIYFTHSLAM